MLISNYYLKIYCLNSFRFSNICLLKIYSLNNRFKIAKIENNCLNYLFVYANVSKKFLISLNELFVYANVSKKFLISLNELFVYSNNDIVINIEQICLNSYVDLNISYIKYNSSYSTKSTNTFIKLSQNPFINVSKMPNMTRFKVYGWFKSGFNRFRGKFWF